MTFLAKLWTVTGFRSRKASFCRRNLIPQTLDYFNKVKTYGDVPWYDKVVNPGDEDLYKARDPRTLVADNMLRDIDQAIEWLPMKSKVDVTRISKDAALALKARFCLFEGTCVATTRLKEIQNSCRKHTMQPENWWNRNMVTHYSRVVLLHRLIMNYSFSPIMPTTLKSSCPKLMILA